MGIINSGMAGGSQPIWPGSKSTQKQPLKDVGQIESANRNVSTPDLNNVEVPTKVGEMAGQKQVQQTQEAGIPTRVSSLSPKDIVQQLANLKMPINDHLKDVALMMAAHGIEISEDSINLVNKLLKGKQSQSAKESAILLVSKGLGNAADDVSILQNLLGKNSPIAETLKNLQVMQQKMSNLLQNSLKDFPALQSFIGTFEEFNDDLKKLKKMDSSNRWLANQEMMIDDLFAMKAFLGGLAKKGIISGDLLNKYLQQLSQLKENLLAQSILNQNSIKQPLGLLESYHYFQIPNPMAAQAYIELLLRKQTGNRAKDKQKNNLSSEQDRIILSMESELLGKITVILTVMGFKVWCTVHSDNEEAVHHVNSFRNELSESLAKYQYKIEEFKTSRKHINIQRFIAPSQDISEVKRIQTEI
ncbi:MAG: hypothetical protein VW397_06830 [Candidatus Margulisiibacteriota bacterium]